MNWNNKLFWLWERYRLLAFLVAAVAIVVVVVSPLTGCAAAPARTASPTKQLADPSIDIQTTSNGSNLIFPAIVLVGAAILELKRQHELRTNP